MFLSKQPLIVVSGPTASGKSDIAIQLARKFNGEIISADSRQVYRGMDIGSGKVLRDKTFPNSKLKILNSKLFYSEGIRHYLIDVASPNRQYSVARFKHEAQKAIRDIVCRGKLPIICGGTGFYIDALIYQSVLPAVKPDAKLRARLSKLTAVELFARLKKLDPSRATTIDRHNPVRLIRALEIVMTTGRPVPILSPRTGMIYHTRPWGTLYLGMTKPMPELKRCIEKRLDARLKNGMIAEVKRLHASGVSWKRLESFGLEYRWVARYLQSKTRNKKREPSSFTEMRNGLLHDIIAYAKRQLTWWRKNPDLVYITNEKQARNLVSKFLKSARGTK